jgi:hypothetical protein
MQKELHFDETIISSTILVKVPRIAYISEKKRIVPELVVLLQKSELRVVPHLSRMREGQIQLSQSANLTGEVRSKK